MNPEPQPKNSKMTRFICQELLYEFALGRLSPERQQDMDTYLTDCRESQRELEKLKRGLRFSAQSLGTKLSPEFYSELMSFEPEWKKRVTNITKKSVERGWNALPYVAIVAAIVSGLFVFKPWLTKDKKEITLAQQLKIEPDSVRPEAQPVRAIPSNLAEVGGGAPVIELAPNLKLKTQNEAAAKTTSAKTEAQPAAVKDKTPGVGQGSLTRADLEVSDFANSSTKIKDKILALGGKAAGNVELGWLKHDDESYFHFSLPESARPELELFLKTFGPVRISTEPHPRIMPEGQIRIILTVKDGGSNDEGREENKTP